MGYAKYFSEDEQVCKCCGEGAERVSPLLLRRLDVLREAWGAPIYVSCMYRCPKHNYEVGGVPTSQHVVGTAADIWVDGNYETFYRFVIDMKLFDGVGYYPSQEFVHVDVRESGSCPNKYQWEG